MKQIFYLSLMFLEGFLIGNPAYAQSEQERYEAYDRCQVDVQACQQAAEHGDAEAQYNLGKMYYTGEGLPQNFQKAKILWEESSKKGSAQSLNGLGLLYYAGEGVQEKNVKLAKELFHKAAQLGEFKALLNMKIMFENNFAKYNDLKTVDSYCFFEYFWK
ncbi:tetratricopeptide repeat protein [Citrobacter braakii]|uniref:tetratricopeptide repeat protein n=1 Tax=Citrobacter braakii TaxID=57706 RepID=UPI0034E4578F